MSQPASFFDGETASEHRVLVEAAGESLSFDINGVHEEVAASQLVRLYSVPGQLRLGRRDRDGWRLVFHEAPGPDIAALLPSRTGSVTPSVSRKAAAISFLASAVVLGMVASLFVAPHLAARQMPLALERRIGDSVKFAAYVPRCENPEAVSALEKIVDRLDPEARADGFTVEILDVPAVNAAALPGGRIVVLEGLIAEAGTADVVAGVLAHEIAHVRRRHVASAAIRQLGVASVVSLIGGGDLSAGAGGLLALKFGRDAEEEADADAVAMLVRAGINPKPTAQMFERMGEAGQGAFAWLSSHPSNTGRAKAFAASHRPAATYRPTLTAEEEDALFEACSWSYLRYGEQGPKD